MAGRFLSAVLACTLLLGAVSAKQYALSFTEIFSPDGARHTTGSPTEVGGNFAFNNDLKVGGFDGEVIGSVTGFCLTGAIPSEADNIEENYYECTQTAYFTVGEYAGSSLTQSALVLFSSSLPLAIVGGTGQFVGARGALYQSADPTDPSSASTDLFIFETLDSLPSPPGSVFPAGSPTCTSPPNACFSADGSIFTCCSGGCGPSGAVPSCS
ncbi:hypothetical protein KFL_001150170 [Klebsormidium nitens]|uniref:Dirigent protein n=1 Tax=Klebsormidium nitens TaxID=105231 RepID=A0A1Y1I1A8_KLENI|nr:hypothetical protein KFL_001150170 [Klebsormidium nitens]|eukprot:GAQ82556.1 hypothetical protein KFL_001150170 [Klebsormidium nitens]